MLNIIYTRLRITYLLITLNSALLYRQVFSYNSFTHIFVSEDDVH